MAGFCDSADPEGQRAERIVIYRRFKILFCIAGCLLLASSKAAIEPPRVLPNDAYIWQFAWTKPLAASVAASSDAIRVWRVLVDETGASRTLHFTAPDWQALAATRRPVILVHRIDGRSDTLDAANILVLTTKALTAARAVGVAVTGVEIDFDCATARLSDYTGFLRSLRARLPADLRLSITALPTWLGSPHLRDLLMATDETVLQVHAVDDPKQGLFDPVQARRWIDRWAEIAPKPFRVALPAYSVRVDWGASGQIVAVTGEAPRFTTGDHAAELVADPAVLSAFAQSLAAHPPATLAGLVWFRLPGDADARGWSAATWHAVLQGTARFSTPLAKLQPTATPGLQDIVLLNPGEMDARLPAKIFLPQGCMTGDGANGYEAVSGTDNFSLIRQEDGLLAGNSSRIIGWSRCPLPNAPIDVQP